MKRTRVSRALGASLLVALAAAGCGSGSASHHTTGKSVPANGAQASTGAKGPSWQGSGVWGNLAKLNNFSLHSAIVVGGSQGASASGATTFDEEYYSPTNYKMVIDPGGSQPITIIFAGGHYYFVSGSQALDMGTNLQGMADMYAGMGASAWEGLYSNSNATYAGSCTVAGRAGDAYDLSATVPLSLGTGGASESIRGSACIDRSSGAPLRTDLKWTMTVGGKSMSYEDSLTVEGVGNVAPIPAPAGAKPVPGTGSGGG